MTSKRLQPFGTTIFAEMTRLALSNGAINLSQGYPDFEGPPGIVDAAVAALRSGDNQYARSRGHPDLVRAVAASRERLYGLTYDPEEEVVVTSGATEGIASSLLGLLDPGDEVVLFEPTYDSYAPCTAMAGGVARYVPLSFPDFALDEEALRAAITDRTRLIVLNTPMNPCGKVFTREELNVIAGLAIDRDLVVLADEVYEHLTFDDAVHVPIASLPGMRERTLTLSSTGKTFSFTGWKIGWATGPRHLVDAMTAAHQFVTYATATPLQAAMAHALTEFTGDYLTSFREEYRERRDFLVAALAEAGFEPSVPRGTYFVLADFRALHDGDDRDFCHWLTREHGVAAIPPSAFYPVHPEKGRHLARFAFCKKMATLKAAAERLEESQMIVAGLQMDLVWEDPRENHRRATAMIERAVRAGARLVALPEMFNTGFTMNAEPAAADAPETRRFLADQAREHGIHLLGGYADAGTERPVNIASIFDPAGREILRYSKIYPFSLAKEHRHFDGGTEIRTVVVEGVRVTALICYDLRFPELFRISADRTDLFVVIANWPAKRSDAWSTLLRARAMESQVFVLGVNRVGVGSGEPHSGDSALHGPMGEPLATATPGEPEVIFGSVVADEVRRARRKFGFLADRRPDVYRALEDA